jgi:hypothetical protein
LQLEKGNPLSESRKIVTVHAPGQERALRAYVANDHSCVDGWVEQSALRSVILLNCLQR